MYFKFHKRLDTTEGSIFYSLVPHKDKILAVGRKKYNERVLKYMYLDTNFDVICDNKKLQLKGEDPRCFYHDGNLYVQDNYWNDMFLMNISKGMRQKIDIPGKNISFISHAGKLYFIHYMWPFVLCEFDFETGEIFPIAVYQDYGCNYEYRGGTPGYQLGNSSVYYGFGHRTYTNAHGTVIHDIFYWEVSFEKDKPYIVIWDIAQPPDSLNICDPTSVIRIDNHLYLITAESNYPWFKEQNYETKIYEICFM